MSIRASRFDTNLTQFYQGVASGGKEQEFEYGGKLDYYLNIDGDKVGSSRWLSHFHVTPKLATAKISTPSTGMLTFANFNMAFPKAGENSHRRH